MRLHRPALQYALPSICLILLLSLFQTSTAHENQPSIAILQFHDNNTLNIEISTNLEALIAGIGPEHNTADFAKGARYAALRKLSSQDLKAAFTPFSKQLLAGTNLQIDQQPLALKLSDTQIPEQAENSSRTSVLHLTTTLPKSAKALTWQWDKAFGAIALRLHSEKQHDIYTAYLESGKTSDAFTLTNLIPPTKGQFLGAKETTYPAWFKDSFLEFKDDVAEAAAQGKRLAILFHQDNCPYCNALVERNLSQQDIQQQMQQNLEVVAINLWGSRELVSVSGKTYTEREFAAALNIQYTPTLLFFNESGKMALRLNGYLAPAAFKRALNYVTQKQDHKQSYTDYIQDNHITAAQTELNSQPFFTQPPYDLRLSATGYQKPLAIFFEQASCPNCDNLHQQVLNDADTQTIIKKFTTIQLDMWSDTPIVTPQGNTLSAREWAKSLNIQYAPSIVLFDKQGKEVIRTEALFKTFHTQSVFDYVLSDAYQTEPSFQRYISHRAEQIQDTGKDVDIWK